MPVWLGLVFSAIGIIFSGYEILNKPMATTATMAAAQIIQKTQQPVFAYRQINMAYDVANQKHWFQHDDGQWRDYPPTPAQLPPNQ